MVKTQDPSGPVFFCAQPINTAILECMDRTLTPLRKQFGRLWRYTASSSFTFAVDLLLLFLLTDAVGLNYLASAAIAFGIAISLNYVLARRFAFRGSTREAGEGYLFFLGIALVGLAIITLGMYLLVEEWHVHYMTARVAIALVAGVWNFLMNSLLNFRN